MKVSRREKIPGPWKRTENDLPPLRGSKTFARRHRQNFRKFDGPGNEKSRASILGDSLGEGWRKLIGDCGPVKEMIFEGDSLRILFACTAANLRGDLKKHQQAPKPKGQSQANEKAKEALRDDVDKLKRLFELKKWRSNTLETWVYPREETRRSLRRLISAMDDEYQQLCKRKFGESVALKNGNAGSLKVAEEESIFSAGKAEDDLVSAEEDTEDGDVDAEEEDSESVSEDAAAKELLASDAGDSDAEESGDLEEDVTAQDDEGLFLAPGFVSDPFEANMQNYWPKVETNDGQLEPLALYEEKVNAAGEGFPGYWVNVVKTDGTCPARFEKHIGKTVEADSVMWEVNNVLPAVKICDWGRDRWDAECFWVYHLRHKVKEYDTSYGMNVRCADLLPMLLPKGLVVQEEKMKTVIQNAWDENLKLNALTRVKTQGNAETSD